jgi:hypothetical protein
LNWNYAGLTYNDSFLINGVDIFFLEWVDTGTRIKVKDPLYGEIKTLTVWSVVINRLNINFAAGEFSNNVWGIYTSS